MVAIKAGPNASSRSSSCCARTGVSGRVTSSAHPFVTMRGDFRGAHVAGGVLLRLVPIPHGPPGVAPALEVHGQRHRDLRHLRPIARLQPQADGPMTAHPPSTADPPVQHLLIQRMAKPVPPHSRCHPATPPAPDLR